METVLKSATKTVTIAPDKPTILIGERINPTGRKKLSATLKAGDLSMVERDALAQVEAGADVLDVNVGAAGVDEVDLLPRAVRLVMETVDVPVAIDTANPEALAAALAEHKKLAPEGKPLINSVNGEEERLEQVLPLVKKYDAAVIALCMDDEGIPKTAERRVEVAKKILSRANDMGIPAEDLLVDCLALTVGADPNAAEVTLGAIRQVREELGLNFTLGASNVSFGLPEREVINWAFLALTIQAGLNSAIVNAAEVRPAVLAADLLLGRDPYGSRYLKAYRKRKKAAA